MGKTFIVRLDAALNGYPIGVLVGNVERSPMTDSKMRIPWQPANQLLPKTQWIENVPINSLLEVDYRVMPSLNDNKIMFILAKESADYFGGRIAQMASKLADLEDREKAAISSVKLSQIMSAQTDQQALDRQIDNLEKIKKVEKQGFGGFPFDKKRRNLV